LQPNQISTAMVLKTNYKINKRKYTQKN